MKTLESWSVNLADSPAIHISGRLQLLVISSITATAEIAVLAPLQYQSCTLNAIFCGADGDKAYVDWMTRFRG